MKSNKIKFLYEFPRFRSEIKELHDILFFFPAYHFGGGERVHADILEIFKDYPTSCFIIHKSSNDFMKEDFYRHTEIIELSKYKSIKYSPYFKTLAKKINEKQNPIVFGCNNLFFYRLLPFLAPHVKVIDLMHAFSYEDPGAPENISLEVSDRIHNRIVLGRKTYNDFIQLYRKNNIDEKLIDRISIIQNKVSIPESYPEKKENKQLKVLFVTRNTHEKRPEVFLEIAKRCEQKNIPVDFTMIGDFNNIPISQSNIRIVGTIKEKEILNKYYSEHDVIMITSFREGFPMVLLEGMAFGVVPISTDVGEIKEHIGEKFSNGFIIKDDSVARYLNQKYEYGKNREWLPKNLLKSIPDDLENCIDQFVQTITDLHNNREKLKSMSLNAYNTVKENFSPEKMKKSYLDIFFK